MNYIKHFKHVTFKVMKNNSFAFWLCEIPQFKLSKQTVKLRLQCEHIRSLFQTAQDFRHHDNKVIQSYIKYQDGSNKIK